MKVLIHASLDLVERMLVAEKILRQKGVTPFLPDTYRYQHIRDEYHDLETFNRIKNKLSLENMRLVEKCDALYVINEDHRNIKGYIGGNSFLEMCIAFYLSKPIFIAQEFSNELPYSEEVLSFQPTIIGSPEQLNINFLQWNQ
jgi:hypothetical protein